MTILLLFTMGIGQMWGQTLLETDDFETESGSGSSFAVGGFKNNNCDAISRSTEARTGSYSLKTTAAATGEKYVIAVSNFSLAQNEILHVIAWAKLEESDETTSSSSNQARPNAYVGGNGNRTACNLTTSWQVCTSNKKYTSSGTKTDCAVWLQRKHGGKKAVLFDDVVIYKSTNETTDIVAPSAATSADATTSAISWTCGSDANTGIANTLIWRRTTGTANDLTLNNQGKYVVPAEGSTLDQSGHWTLVSATVAADAESYSGTFAAGDVYAIVHRDLAYNYSEPEYVTIPASTNYTVTIDPNGGSYAETPSGWSYSEGVYTKSVAAGSFTPPTGLTNSTKDLTWKDNHGTGITFPITLAKDSTFVAQWADHTASSDATLSALSVTGCTLNETFDPDEEDYTINLPFYALMPVVGDVTATKNDANAEDPEVSISSNVITIHCEAEDGTEKDYTITVTIAPAPTASSSINIEQLILDNSRAYNIGDALDAAHIGYTNKNDLDSLKPVSEKADRNLPYLGLKFKSSSSTITVIVPAGETLKVKFGDRKTAVQVAINDGVAAAATITDDVYSLTATSAVRQVKFSVTENNKTIVLKQVMVGEDIKTVNLPWKVTYTVGANGTCATASAVWTGTALNLPAVTPNSGWDFNGWFTAATEGSKVGDAGDSYTPTADVELFAQYTAQASPYDLTALTYQIGTGAATNVGYEDGTYTYNIELPYAPSYDAITVTPTLKVGTSSLKGDEVLTVSSLPGAATFTVVADDLSEQLYTVNFSKEAKEGLSIIETKVTGQNAHGPVGGLIGGDAAVAVASSYKLNSGNYVGVTLAGSNKFQAGDVVVIRVTNVENATGFTLYTTNDADSALIIDTRGTSTIATGLHYITLPETYPDGVTPYAGTPSVYLLRANNSTTGNMNPRVDSIAVLRAMNPVLKAIRFNSTDVAVTSTSVSATLPNGTNLASMTVTPTIYWNGAGTAAVTGSWAWGANTYVVTDKDGDATTYTITLTEDELKHDVTFNTHGGSAVAPVQVVHNGYLAAAPTAPTKTDYDFLYWSETEDGAEVDMMTVQITEDKEFHAVWAAEPAGITLFDGEGNLNTTNFVSPAKTTIEISEVEYTCLAEFASNRSSSLAGATPADMVQYNATTDQAKIKMTFYNNNSGVKKAILYKYEEGAEEPEKIEIEVPGQTIFTTDYYTFNSSKNRSFYVCMNDRSNIRVLQVKVIDNGANPVKQFGQAGYSLNFNKGRLYAKDGVEKSFEGWTLTASSEYKVYNNSNLATKSANTFTVASAVLMHVEKSGGKYYVYQDPADKGTLYDANADIELNTTGTWYISSETASAAASFTKIEFIAPKCAEPAFNSLANSDICSGDPYVALNGTATVADAGVPTYKWYAEGADESDPAAVLGTGATYTPEADGNYYVIATNHLADYTDNTKKSDLVTVTTHAGTTITGYTNANGAAGATGKQISVTAEGVGTLHYVWYTCDDELGSNPVALPENDAATLSGITIPSGIQYYKVVVTSTCGSAEQILFAKEWVDVELQDVTGSMIWNWHKTQNPDAWTGIDGDITVASTSVLANVNYGQIPNVTNFHSAMLKVVVSTVETKIRKGTDNGVIQGNEIMFHTTVPGIVIVTYRGTGNSANVTLTIGSETLPTYAGSMTTSKKVFVPAGDVVISSGSDAFRIQKIQFIAEADYPRNVTQGRYGTICLPNGGVMVGADIYEVAYMDYQAGHPYKIYFDEVLNGEMVAGRPYVFLPQVGATQLGVFYTDALNADAGSYKGLYGSYTRIKVPMNDGNYILLNNQYYFVDSDNVYCGANKAYIKLADVPQHDPGMPAYGRRRISMGVNSESTATAIDELNASETPVKIMIDGTMYILRGEKMYDATGRLVK